MIGKAEGVQGQERGLGQISREVSEPESDRRVEIKMLKEKKEGKERSEFPGKQIVDRLGSTEGKNQMSKGREEHGEMRCQMI